MKAISGFKGLIWYRLKRAWIKNRDRSLIKANNSLNNNQVKMVEICNYLISNIQTDLTFSRLTETYFLEYYDVSCKIDDNRVVITNGIYSHEISLPEAVISDIRDRFLNQIESRKRKVEKKIAEKLSVTLSSVHEDIIKRSAEH